MPLADLILLVRWSHDTVYYDSKSTAGWEYGCCSHTFDQHKFAAA